MDFYRETAKLTIIITIDSIDHYRRYYRHDVSGNDITDHLQVFIVFSFYLADTEYLWIIVLFCDDIFFHYMIQRLNTRPLDDSNKFPISMMAPRCIFGTFILHVRSFQHLGIKVGLYGFWWFCISFFWDEELLMYFNCCCSHIDDYNCYYQ